MSNDATSAPAAIRFAAHPPETPTAVIGAAGFLGSALVTALRSTGIPVTAFTRKTPFLTDSGLPDVGLRAARTVFALASSINPATAESRPELVRQDRENFVALLRALERLPDPPRVILVSSGGTVYDPALPPPYREDSPTRPVGAYGRAKLDLERRLRLAALGRGRASVARVANAYGPGQPATGGQGVIGHWLRAVAAGQPITIFGDPGAVRDYVYVDDIAAALVAMQLLAGPLPPVVNVGSGVPTSLADLADIVRAVTGSAAEIRRVPGRGFDVPRCWLDVRLAAEVLGWRACTSLPDGIAAAWRWVSGPR